MLSRNPITDDTLLAYAAGDLTGPDAERVAVHLAGHPADARRVATYRQVAAIRAADDSVAPPRDVVARAKSIFRHTAAAPAPSGPGWIERLEAIVATLIYDSRLQAATVRDGGGGGRFQLSFETADDDVDLQAERVADDGTRRWRLMGQIGGATPVAEVEITLAPTSGTGPAVRTRTDPRALFSLETAEGTYDLRIAMPGRVVILPGIRFA